MLRKLSFKIQSALRTAARNQIAPDLEALVMAAGHAMQAGPRPLADADLLGTIRAALRLRRRRQRVMSPWGCRMIGPTTWSGWMPAESSRCCSGWIASPLQTCAG